MSTSPSLPLDTVYPELETRAADRRLLEHK